MGELEERLNAVLSDPKAMAEITRMAQQLMGPGEASPPPDGPAPPAAPDLSALPGLLRGLGGGGHPLARAMGPYLGEERRRRLERALGIAAAARMAGNALRGMGGAHGV